MFVLFLNIIHKNQYFNVTCQKSGTVGGKNSNSSCGGGGDGEHSVKHSPVLLGVLVLPSLHSKDSCDESAEEEGGGIPHLGRIHKRT